MFFYEGVADLYYTKPQPRDISVSNLLVQFFQQTILAGGTGRAGATGPFLFTGGPFVFSALVSFSSLSTPWR